jgi:hypothetical protein
VTTENERVAAEQKRRDEEDAALKVGRARRGPRPRVWGPARRGQTALAALTSLLTPAAPPGRRQAAARAQGAVAPPRPRGREQHAWPRRRQGAARDQPAPPAGPRPRHRGRLQVRGPPGPSLALRRAHAIPPPFPNAHASSTSAPPHPPTRPSPQGLPPQRGARHGAAPLAARRHRGRARQRGGTRSRRPGRRASKPRALEIPGQRGCPDASPCLMAASHPPLTPPPRWPR